MYARIPNRVQIDAGAIRVVAAVGDECVAGLVPGTLTMLGRLVRQRVREITEWCQRRATI